MNPLAISNLFKAAQRAGSKSTVLASLQAPFGLCLLGAVVCGVEQAPPWLTVSLAAAAGVIGLAMLRWFGHFAKTAPDYLRSEGYNLRAMEMRLLGDSEGGLRPTYEAELQQIQAAAAEEKK